MTGKIQPKLVQELEPEETEPKPATDALEHKETTAAADNAAELHTTEEQLDEDEREFRAMRLDLPGVKGAAAAGIVAISVGKAPTKNEFFRTHPTFRPITKIVDHEVGMERTYFAVAADMVEPLAAIGRFDDPQWPDLKPAKIFRLAFRDKGRLIDSTEHPLFKKWAARDSD